MKITYCLPIIKRTKKAVLETIEQQYHSYQAFEVWTDYIEDLDEIFIIDLISDLQEKLILVMRRKNLAKIQMPLENRLSIIASLEGSKSFFDLDTTTQVAELAYVKNNPAKCRLILSYHNYKETPSSEALRTIIKSMAVYHPTIFKIATECKSEEDSLRLLDLLLQLKGQKKRCLVLGMGEFGKITRIFGSLWGNEFVFAPLSENESSAPGQIIKQDLEKILKILDAST